MTRLVIDVFPRPNTTEGSDPRDAGYVAIAVEPGKALEQGGLGGGMTQRLAAEAAVRSFYARPLISEPLSQDENSYDAQVRAWEDEERIKARDAWDAGRRENQTHVVKRVAVSETEIKELLTSAIQNSFAQLHMVYQDANGTRTTRIIEPHKFEARRVGLGFEETYVHAKDVEKNQPRLFRLARIERLEAV